MSGSGTSDGTVLVTGASSGIGYELTERFASEGYDTVLVSRSEEKLRSIADDFQDRYGTASLVVPADLAEAGAARDVYDAVSDQGRTVDVLVNNAGFGLYGDYLETDLESELDLVQLKIATVVHLTKLFVRDMVEAGGGRVLNVSSVTGVAPVSTAAVYAGTNHFLLGFSEALAENLDGEGVSVTALCPGETDTGFLDHGNVGESALPDQDLMDPADVAKAAYDGLMAGDRVVVPGLKNKVRVQLKRVLPPPPTRTCAPRRPSGTSSIRARRSRRGSRRARIPPATPASKPLWPASAKPGP